MEFRHVQNSLFLPDRVRRPHNGKRKPPALDDAPVPSGSAGDFNRHAAGPDAGCGDGRVAPALDDVVLRPPDQADRRDGGCREAGRGPVHAVRDRRAHRRGDVQDQAHRPVRQSRLGDGPASWLRPRLERDHRLRARPDVPRNGRQHGSDLEPLRLGRRHSQVHLRLGGHAPHLRHRRQDGHLRLHLPGKVGRCRSRWPSRRSPIRRTARCGSWTPR